MDILLVDDDSIDRKMIVRALREGGSFAKITEVESVAEAQYCLGKHSYDVILLDYRMPEIDGLELLIQLRAEYELGNAAIVMVSASTEEDLAIKCIESGAQDFLSKEDITTTALSKAILHAKKRFELEKKMYTSYISAKNMAERDPLTGLSNRFHFDETLKVMIANTKRAFSNVALLTLDFDNFKHVNDTLGHAAGDELLVQAVKRIANCLRSNEGFARLGGDEFALVMGNIENSEDVAGVATRMLSQFEKPFELAGELVYSSASVGAAMMPGDACNAAELMKCADIALYRAKEQGKNCFCFYEAEYQNQYKKDILIQSSLRSILQNSSFDIAFQPIFDIDTKKTIGFEALLRWPQNDENNFTPDQFIPIAERSGMMPAITEWVANTAFGYLSEWKALTSVPLRMSINVSPIQLTSHEVATSLIEAAEANKIMPTDVILEITETALIKDADKVSKVLETLTNYGFNIALDDFGTGFSSISHINNYPISIIKLDKSMQAGNTNAQRKIKTLRALTTMLSELDFTLVVEGIETQEQLLCCESCNIHYVQGFLLGKPLSPDATRRLVENEN